MQSVINKTNKDFFLEKGLTIEEVEEAFDHLWDVIGGDFMFKTPQEIRNQILDYWRDRGKDLENDE